MFEKLINLVRKSKSKIKKPVIAKPRFPCPFYGFHEAFGTFMDQKGNQCPVIGHTCRMEYCPSGPDWNKCFCEKHKKTINYVYDYLIVPDEFWPEGKSSWRGMPFKTWMDYVMDPDTPRPVTLKMSETTAKAGNNH